MTLTLNYCCCGCSLRQGTSIIAVYLLVSSIMLTVLSSIMLGNMDNGVDHYGRTAWGYDVLPFNNGREMSTILIYGIVGGIMQIILNSLLLVGVNKENKPLVSIWLGSYAVICGLGILSLVFSFYQYHINPNYQVGVLISIGLTMYFLLVVRSYLYSLADGHNRQQNSADVYNIENSNIKRMPLA